MTKSRAGMPIALIWWQTSQPLPRSEPVKTFETDNEKCAPVRVLEMHLNGRQSRSDVANSAVPVTVLRARCASQRDPAARWRLFERESLF